MHRCFAARFVGSNNAHRNIFLRGLNKILPAVGLSTLPLWQDITGDYHLVLTSYYGFALTEHRPIIERSLANHTKPALSGA